MTWQVYLSGEIHTDWRDQIIAGAKANDLDIAFTSANTHHESSDAAGDVLGRPNEDFWRDHQSAKINSLRIKTLIQKCDIAVIRFGDKYKQWNAAFDAGQCAASGKPYITLHDADMSHALKEVDGAAAGLGKVTGSGGGDFEVHARNVNFHRAVTNQSRPKNASKT